MKCRLDRQARGCRREDSLLEGRGERVHHTWVSNFRAVKAFLLVRASGAGDVGGGGLACNSTHTANTSKQVHLSMPLKFSMMCFICVRAEATSGPAAENSANVD